MPTLKCADDANNDLATSAGTVNYAGVDQVYYSSLPRLYGFDPL
ncbi:MAG TPA: hypothetical protein VG425_03460 [Casimicrobiaceae bacterium]|nr:hypothetical protein [Casimicrobiaceae bacterium]